MSTYLNRTAVDVILQDLQGQMITVDFHKKDGSKRRLNGQLVASPGSHNGHSQLFTIALSNTKKESKSFRSASRDKITRISGKGNVFQTRESLQNPT
jgi:hypothetical protein